MDDSIKGKPFTSETAPRQGGKAGRISRKKLVQNFIDQAALTSHNERLNAALGLCAATAPKTIEEQVVASLVLQALSGDISAIKEILDSAKGKNTDKLDMQAEIKAMGTVKDNSGHALTFDIGSEPDKLLIAGETGDDSDE